MILFEDAHMKHVVDASAGWKLEADSDLVDEFQHTVGPIEWGFSLPVESVAREAGERCRRRSSTHSPT